MLVFKNFFIMDDKAERPRMGSQRFLKIMLQMGLATTSLAAVTNSLLQVCTRVTWKFRKTQQTPRKQISHLLI